MNRRKNLPKDASAPLEMGEIHPPRSEDDLVRWLQLKRSPRVGGQTFFRLLNEYGSAEKALEKLPEIAQKAGITHYKPVSLRDALNEYQAGQRMGAELITIGCPTYPKGFSDLSPPPPLFWAKGDMTILQKPLIGIVGMRNASPLGMRMGEKIAAELGQKGFGIVSGLARGIDTAAHQGALATGSIGVLASGIDIIYPEQNKMLARKMCETGLIISEMALGHPPNSGNFPLRNRLIAALSLSLLVVEATKKSGSLMTANIALDMGRDIFAVPGHPFDERSAGTNHLIRDGARLVRSSADIIAELGAVSESASPPKAPAPAPAPAPKTQPAKKHPLHSLAEPASNFIASLTRPKAPSAENGQAAINDKILSYVGSAPICENQLLRDIGLTHHHLAQSLLELELSGAITREAGGLIRRKYA